MDELGDGDMQYWQGYIYDALSQDADSGDEFMSSGVKFLLEYDWMRRINFSATIT